MRKLLTLETLWVLLCVLAIGAGLNNIFRGFDHSIFDHHGFRQSQTALSIHFLLQGGAWLQYETPVFGAPWAIPMEFPLYQWLAALTAWSTDLPVDQAARAVSIFFYLLGLPVLWLLFRVWGFGRGQSLIAPALFAVSPLILYWSRTVMIESTTYGLSLLYLLFVSLYYKHPDRKNLMAALATIAAILAALSKVTTFVLFCVFAAGIVLNDHHKNHGFKVNKKILLDQWRPLFGFALIPVGIAAGWVKYSDYLKSLNPLADGFITSKALQKWNFGTWDQLWSMDTWTRFADVQWNLTLGTFGALIGLGVLLPVMSKNRFLAGMAAFSYFVGFLIFTNLYFVHDYYGAGNAVLLIIAAALILATFFESENPGCRIAGLLLFLLIGSFSFDRYKTGYYRQVVADNRYFTDDLGKGIQNVVAEDEVILIYGEDWNSSVPYGARRRAIMDRSNLPLDSEKMAKVVAATGKEKITALVVCHGMRDQPDFIQARIDFLGLDPNPITHSTCTIYRKLPKNPGPT